MNLRRSTAFAIPVLVAARLLAVSPAFPATDPMEAQITVRADRPGHRLSRLLTGACIEDVNHEIYGGLYSQMIFGESFQEPPPAVPPNGFTAFGGSWSVAEGELRGSAGDGPKLVSGLPAFENGEAGVEVWFEDRKPGNAGFIVRVNRPGVGADNFDGYEISLDPAGQIVRLGRHRHNWEHIRDVPCEVPIGRWIPLEVRLADGSIEVRVNGRSLIRHEDGGAALPPGNVGLRQWQREAKYRNFRVSSGGREHLVAFERSGEESLEVSGMWRAFRRGNAAGACAIEKSRPFLGRQSQAIRFAGGAGELGIENQGLNRWGMCFAKGKRYEGVVWAKGEAATDLWVGLESADGAAVYAESRLRLKPGGWQRLEFALTPRIGEAKGRFVIKLKRPGAVALGYAFLQPGKWGRFKGLPVRGDVAEALIDQGITVLRYGGSMINHPEYRWKQMIGPRDRRPPYRGTWYVHSSNGWGIPDFMTFCEAAGFEYIPAFNMDETPQDMADFIEYAKGRPHSRWGRQRVEDGRPRPYRLRYLELGNEERVDAAYAAKFEALAKTIWERDPELVLVVGDFLYREPIRDPFNFRGAASGITNLVGQQRILRLAGQHGGEVWFDLHVGTDGPLPDSTYAGMFSFRDALAQIADGARHKVVIFEFNAGNHTQRRALANALAILGIERDGRIPVATSANCLQADGQNDNGWDQGLLFLDPGRVWLQPPGWVTRMIATHYQPLHVETSVRGDLQAGAKRSDDGGTLVLQVVNTSDRQVPADIILEGFSPRSAVAGIEELAGPLDVRNTANDPGRLVPKISSWPHGFTHGRCHRAFPPYSFTVMEFR